MARFAPSTLTSSTAPPVFTRPVFRMPAVSTIRKCRRCQVSGESTASRVVPGISLTSIRSSLSSRFTSDDLPTLGRPDDGDGGFFDGQPFGPGHAVVFSVEVP